MSDSAPAELSVSERESGVELVAPQLAQALRQLVNAHFDFIWRSLRRLGLSPSDADDASQEVFMVAARKLAAIEPGRERSFLFSCAFKVCSTHRRTTARRREADESPAEPAAQTLDPEELVALRRARVTLDEILGELDLEARSVFVLFELEELSAPQISELLEVPQGTVASRLRRARELFQKAVRRHRARQEFDEGGEP